VALGGASVIDFSFFLSWPCVPVMLFMLPVLQAKGHRFASLAKTGWKNFRRIQGGLRAAQACFIDSKSSQVAADDLIYCAACAAGFVGFFVCS
jgi:hypothetical protein